MLRRYYDRDHLLGYSFYSRIACSVKSFDWRRRRTDNDRTKSLDDVGLSLAGCIIGNFGILGMDAERIPANGTRAHIFSFLPPKEAASTLSRLIAAVAVVVCLTCRILVPVKSVFLLKASPLPKQSPLWQWQ